MKTIIAILLALTVLVSVGQAQKIKGFEGSLKLGYLNAPGSATAFSSVSSKSVSGFSNDYFAFGADGYYRTGNIMVGLTGISGVQNSSSSGIHNATPWVGATHARVGYILNKKSDSYWIYPSFGMGSSWAMLMGESKGMDGTTYHYMDRMLFSPSLDFGINADFLLNKVSPERTKYGAVIMGVRAGYYASVSKNTWHNDNWDTVPNSPSYASNAFYITLSVGGGWFMKKM